MSEAEGRVALDTSVIVAAVSSWHEHHARALPLVRAALAVAGGPIVPVPALVESFSVLTRLPPPWRLRPQDAHALLDRTFRGRSTLFGLQGDQVWGLLDEATASNTAGGAAHDAHIVACARQAGAATIATFNRRHFERLDLGPMTLLVP